MLAGATHSSAGRSKRHYFDRFCFLESRAAAPWLISSKSQHIWYRLEFQVFSFFFNPGGAHMPVKKKKKKFPCWSQSILLSLYGSSGWFSEEWKSTSSCAKIAQCRNLYEVCFYCASDDNCMGNFPRSIKSVVNATWSHLFFSECVNPSSYKERLWFSDRGRVVKCCAFAGATASVFHTSVWICCGYSLSFFFFKPQMKSVVFVDCWMPPLIVLHEWRSFCLFPALSHTHTHTHIHIHIHTHKQPNASMDCWSIRYDIRVVSVCGQPVSERCPRRRRRGCHVTRCRRVDYLLSSQKRQGQGGDGVRPAALLMGVCVSVFFGEYCTFVFSARKHESPVRGKNIWVEWKETRFKHGFICCRPFIFTTDYVSLVQLILYTAWHGN